MEKYGNIPEEVGSQHTHHKYLVPVDPSLLVYTDTLSFGFVGIWCSINNKIQDPVVWRSLSPQKIKIYKNPYKPFIVSKKLIPIITFTCSTLFFTGLNNSAKTQ